jgi:hypothetical protein
MTYLALRFFRRLDSNPPQQTMQVYMLLRARAITRREHLIFHMEACCRQLVSISAFFNVEAMSTTG